MQDDNENKNTKNLQAFDESDKITEYLNKIFEEKKGEL
jgi:hypothetical protein